ncbi:hypothetical protein NSQ43_16330 [Sporosarcina sp. FSL W8-0480]|uniref:hypothetical protein n=1 Tax=Sporosarcina sp. FSL W8-0480 TaxID=2954701 RepID=UPI0030DBBC1E
MRSRNRISAQESPPRSRISPALKKPNPRSRISPALKKPNPRSRIFPCAQEIELALKNLPLRSRNRIRAQQSRPPQKASA